MLFYATLASLFIASACLGAEGFFSVRQKDNGVWTFVDPDGNDIFMRAVDHVGGDDPHLMPDVDTEAIKADMAAWGFVAQGVRSGNDFKPVIAGTPWMCTVKLGNVLGETDDPERGFVLNLHLPGTAFPNVFREGFEEDAFRLAEERCGPHRDDRLLVGYCIDNELAFHGRNRGLSQKWGLFEAARNKPATNTAHVALMQFLAKKGIARPEDAPMNIREEFCRMVARRYFDVTTRAIRAADPNHLILGCRFASRFDWSDEEAGKFVDVLTFNCYPCVDLDREALDPAVTETFHAIYRRAKKPLMVTEWSFPALDLGYGTEGAGEGQRFATQAQRTKATEIFARTMLSMPFVIGYSYFMWKDVPPDARQPTNYGLVDRNGKPFPELTGMFSKLHSTDGLAFARPDGVKFERNANSWRFEAAGGLVLSGEIGRNALCRISYNETDFGFATAGMMLDTGVEAPEKREGTLVDWPRINKVTTVELEKVGDYRQGIRITGEGSSGAQHFEIMVRVVLMDAPNVLRFEILSIKNTGDSPLRGMRAILSHPTPFKDVVKSGRNADSRYRDYTVWGKPSIAEVRNADNTASMTCTSCAKTLHGISFSVDKAGILRNDVFFTPWFEAGRGPFGALDALCLAPGEEYHPTERMFDEIVLQVGEVE